MEEDRRACPKAASSESRPRTISGRWAPTARAAHARRSSTTMAIISPAALRAARMRTATASSRSGTSSSCSTCRRTDEIVSELPKPIDRHRHGARARRGGAAGRPRQLRHGHVQGADRRVERADARRQRRQATAGQPSHHRRPSARPRASWSPTACCRRTRAAATSCAGSCAARCGMRICSAPSEPLMHRLVPALVAEMGAAYPELVRAQPLIEATSRAGGDPLPPDARQRPEAARRSDGRPGVKAARCPARPPSSSTTPSASPTI